jgi:hypothetical protein
MGYYTVFRKSLIFSNFNSINMVMMTAERTIGDTNAAIGGKVCGANLNMAAAASGVAIAYLGLDRTFPLPSEVHYGLGGAAVATYCQTGFMRMPDPSSLMMPAMYGVVGGMAFAFIRPQLGI